MWIELFGSRAPCPTKTHSKKQKTEAAARVLAVGTDGRPLLTSNNFQNQGSGQPCRVHRHKNSRLPSFPSSVAAAERKKTEKKNSPQITVGSRRHRRLLGLSEAVIGDHTERHSMGEAWPLLESKLGPLVWILLGEFNAPAHITVVPGFRFENSTAFLLLFAFLEMDHLILYRCSPPRRNTIRTRYPSYSCILYATSL